MEITYGAENEESDINFEMLQYSLVDLRELAKETILEYGLKHNEFTLICVQIDSEWIKIVKALTPEFVEPEREPGELGVALGSVSPEVCTAFAEAIPDLADRLNKEPEEGMVKVVVLSKGYCSVYDLEPEIIVRH